MISSAFLFFLFVLFGKAVEGSVCRFFNVGNTRTPLTTKSRCRPFYGLTTALSVFGVKLDRKFGPVGASDRLCLPFKI